MPGFDILAFSTGKQTGVRVQIKTIKSTGDWQLNAKDFLRFDSRLFNKGTQRIIGVTTNYQTDYFVFVRQGNEGYGTDKFYILSAGQLTQIVKRNYGAMLTKCSGKRPKNQKTTHTAIRNTDLELYKDNWSVLSKKRGRGY